MADLRDLFATHVVEVIAKRRMSPQPWQGLTRRFICTNSYPLLNSIEGKVVFHFRAPSNVPRYNAAAYNLLTVFDLYMQDYRCINLDDYRILGAIPVRTEEEIAMFWQYFNSVMSKQSATEKLKKMNT